MHFCMGQAVESSTQGPTWTYSPQMPIRPRFNEPLMIDDRAGATGQAPKAVSLIAAKADGWPQRLCPTAAIPPSRPLLHRGRDGAWTEPARHVSVRPAQQRIWWCTRRPKLPFLPQRGEAQTWSLAKPVQTPMAGFKPLSQESNRASSCQRLLSSSPRPPSNSFQPSSQLVILASKKLSTLQSSICRNNNQKQQSELLRYLRDRQNVRFQKSCCSKCLRSPLCSLGALTRAARSRSFLYAPPGCCKRPVLVVHFAAVLSASSGSAKPPSAC